jgi:hypothetical protein
MSYTHFFANLTLLSTNFFKSWFLADHRWLKPVILATWEAELRRIEVGNPGK